jgi:3-methyladenine DNA glycosylase AlkD
MTYLDARKALHSRSLPEKAGILQRFFKTGKGEYAEGDRFLGVVVPAIRQLVKQFAGLKLPEVERLVRSPYNEERLLALLIWEGQYRKGDAGAKQAVYRGYLKNLDRVNNWNLVDASAPYIVGAHLVSRSRALLFKLARSKNLWRRRIAIVSTLHFIRRGDFQDALRLAAQLLRDEHDLIHKACGWMLREIGKKDIKPLEAFLRKHASRMPRTMLRYAIERFPERERQAYLRG